MNITKKEIDAEYGKPVIIYAFSDVHEGNSGMNLAAFQTMLTKGKEEQVWYLGAGDYLDCVVANDSKRFDPREIADHYRVKDLSDLPKAQADRFGSYFVGQADRVLALAEGNHEQSYRKYNSFSIYDYMCSTHFGQSQKLGYCGYLRLTLNLPDNTKYRVDFWVNHGSGSASGAGGASNNISKLSSVITADVCLFGHLHRLSTNRQQTIELAERADGIVYATQWHGMTGCFLESLKANAESYFSSKTTRLADIGYLRIEIRVDRIKNKRVKTINVVPVYLR